MQKAATLAQGWRWRIPVILGVTFFVNYLDRNNLALALPQIANDFGWNNETLANNGQFLQDINGKGGIGGRKIQLNYQDSQADPKQSVLIAQKFATDNTILAELGDFASPASMAASSIYERAGLVQFGFTNSNPDFTKGGDHMFSTSVTQSVAAVDMAQKALNILKGHKQAELYLDTSWGQSNPRLLCMDEPTMGLAPIVVERVLDMIVDLQRRRMTIFMVEQNAELALSIASRGYVLQSGKLVVEGNAHDLLHDPAIREAYLGKQAQQRASAPLLPETVPAETIFSEVFAVQEEQEVE